MVDRAGGTLQRSPVPTATVSLFLVTAVVLGVLEGVIVARSFRLAVARCAGLMILASLLVSWIGFVLLPMLPHAELRHEWGPALIVLVGTWAVILVLEWPFVALCLGGGAGWLGRSVRGALAAVTAGFVVLLAVATLCGGVGRRFAEDDSRAMAIMRADLHSLVNAQESYFADHASYARRVEALRAAALPYVPDSFDVVTLTAASDSGWSATARRAIPPARARTAGAASLKTCGIFVGRAPPPLAGEPEGEPRCR